MNYTELKVNIEDICEQSFTDDQMAMFTQQAEQKILLLEAKNASQPKHASPRLLLRRACKHTHC